jgi:hypothetical protein
MSPMDVFKEIENKRKPVIVGELKLYPPGGKSVLSKSYEQRESVSEKPESLP